MDHGNGLDILPTDGVCDGYNIELYWTFAFLNIECQPLLKQILNDSSLLLSLFDKLFFRLLALKGQTAPSLLSSKERAVAVFCSTTAPVLSHPARAV